MLLYYVCRLPDALERVEEHFLELEDDSEMEVTPALTSEDEDASERDSDEDGEVSVPDGPPTAASLKQAPRIPSTDAYTLPPPAELQHPAQSMDTSWVQGYWNGWGWYTIPTELQQPVTI